MTAVVPGAPTGVRLWVALAALSIPVVALSVDMNGVVVLLGPIAADLGVSATTAGAIVTVASLAYAAPLLLVGRVADRVGARPLLIGGVVGFWVASAVCATATTFGVLMAGRALQGVASACCMTTSLVAINALFDRRRQPVAIGIWAALGGVGGAVGPLVASAIGEAWSWRWFFGVNLVLLAVSAVLLAGLVPRLPAAGDLVVPVGRLVVLAVGLAGVVGGVQHVSAGGWVAAGTVVPIAAGLALLAVVWWRRNPAVPLVPAAVVASPTFRHGTAQATLSNWGSGVVMVLVPLALQTERGLGVLATGLVFVAFSAPFALGGAVSGRLVNAWGGRRTLAVSAAVFTAGIVVLAVTGATGPMVAVGVGLAVSGLGNGVIYSAATSVALGGVATVDASEATAALGMLRVIALAVAVAVSTSMLASFDAVGLRLALVVAAVITGAGVAVARRASDAPVAPAG